MADYQPSRSTRVFARDGSLLANLYSRTASGCRSRSIPQPVRNAFIATEDQHFYQHHGVDFGGILRAAHRRLAARGIPRRLDDHAAARARAVSLERSLDLAQGARGAARDRDRALLHEGRDPRALPQHDLLRLGRVRRSKPRRTPISAPTSSHLTIGQAAMLAGLPAAPSDYSPFVEPAIARRNASGTCSTAWSRAASSRREQADAELRRPLGLIARAPDRLAVVQVSVLHDLRHASARSAVRDAGDVRRRPAGLHDAGSAHAASARRTPSTGASAQRQSRGDRRARRPRSSRSGRRPARFWRWSAAPAVLAQQSVQSRVASAAPAGLVVQSLRLHGGDRQRRCRRRRSIDDSPISYPMGDGTRWAPSDDDHRFSGRSRCATRSRNRATSSR